jgi:hypothetical protein
MPLFVNHSVVKGYHFTPLQCSILTWDEYYVKHCNGNKSLSNREVQDKCINTRKNVHGKRVSVCGIVMLIGHYPAIFPLYVTNNEIDTIESRKDWQSHKYTFLSE